MIGSQLNRVLPIFYGLELTNIIKQPLKTYLCAVFTFHQVIHFTSNPKCLKNLKKK